MAQTDHLFFDELYQMWSKTTGVSDGYYWIPEIETFLDEPNNYRVVSHNPKTGDNYVIAFGMNEADAEFLSGCQGALPELVRALHDAHNEADRADEARDIAMGDLAETLLENAALREEIVELEKQLGAYSE